MDEARKALDELIQQRGYNYSSISRLLGRNAAYIQQYIRRGSPRSLDEQDRAVLARFFGVDEKVLGAPDRRSGPVVELVHVPVLSVEASAGHGALAEMESKCSQFGFDEKWLRRLTASKASSLSIIGVHGDSMEPTLHDRDQVMVELANVIREHADIPKLVLDMIEPESPGGQAATSSELRALDRNILELVSALIGQRRVIAETLDEANGEILEHNRSPARAVGELDNRGSHFYLALYWAKALARRDNSTPLAARFKPLAETLTAEEAKINAELLADRQARDLSKLDVMMVYRTDRYGRGGDQVEMLAAGFPAVRVTEAAEHYDRQHQDLRTVDGRKYGDTIDGVDFPYLARVTRLNAMAMAALAKAPAPPEGVKIEGAVSPDTKVSWNPVPGAARYRVWRRGTTDPQWTTMVETTETSQILKGVVIDDWFFGVSAVSADGHESPVVFPGTAGSFISPPPAGK